jgi:prepilin-type N-terminal cleavage/methylation domain-containing protein
MPITRRSLFSARKSRGGFTLVELLVVIAIIALLAGVAVGPITGAMKTAKDNAGMQTTHSLYISDFNYTIDNQNFADAQDAGYIARALLNGGYITDTSIFYLPGGNTQKWAAADAAGGITAAYVAWDFYGVNGAGATPYVGVSTTDPDQLPLLWSTGNTVVLPAAAGQYGTATVNGSGKNAFGTDGIPVAYKSGASAFKKVSVLSSGLISQFVDNSFVMPANTQYVVRQGSE